MKRMLSLLIAFSIIFATFLPLQASAVEEKYDITDHNQVLTLAKKVFPEYAEKLNESGLSSRNTHRMASPEIYPIVQKTRMAGNNTSITYTEYNNGIIALGAFEYTTNAELNIEDSETHSAYEQFTARITATVLGGPTFYAKNIGYKIYASNYDRITSAGEYGLEGYGSDSIEKVACKIDYVENASKPASIDYSFPIWIGTGYHSGNVYLKLQNNVASVIYDVRQ